MAVRADMVAAAVRDGDRDRYLATLYAPRDRRAALFALYAFDIEVSRVRDHVSEPLPGEIRLQWWRDAIDAGQGGGHPVADALVEAVSEYRLPKVAFAKLLDARIFDLYDDPMPDRAALEAWCGETASAVFQLAALIVDPEAAPAAAEAAGHAGCAVGMAGILRQLPRQVARGQCCVPLDLLAAAGSDRDQFVSGESAPANRRAIEAMVALGREHDAKFRAAAAGLPASLRPALLPAATARAWLDRFARAADPLRKPVSLSPLRRQWILLRAASRGF